MRREFKEQYDPGKKYLVGGALLNKTARAINNITGQWPDAFEHVIHGGNIESRIRPRPAHIGIATIITGSQNPEDFYYQNQDYDRFRGCRTGPGSVRWLCRGPPSQFSCYGCHFRAFT